MFKVSGPARTRGARGVCLIENALCAAGRACPVLSSLSVTVNGAPHSWGKVRTLEKPLQLPIRGKLKREAIWRSI
jgi:hypothetical protein